MNDTPGNDEGREAQDEATPGERLRAAREASGQDVQEVARRLRIDSLRITAMEEGDISALGAPVFAAGYVRAYARLVGLPSEELLSDYALDGAATTPPALDESPLARPTTTRWSRSRAPRRKAGGGKGWRAVLIWLLVALVLAAAAGWWLMMQRGGVLPSAAVGEQAAARQQLSLPHTPAGDAQAAGRPAEVVPETTPGNEPTVPDRQAAEPVSGAGVAGDAASSSAPTRQPAEDELEIAFSEDSWVELYDGSGKRLLHRLARAGEALSFVGPAPFKLVLGYVPGVRLRLNGEAVDLSPYRGRRLARLTLAGDSTRNENRP